MQVSFTLSPTGMSLRSRLGSRVLFPWEQGPLPWRVLCLFPKPAATQNALSCCSWALLEVKKQHFKDLWDCSRTVLWTPVLYPTDTSHSVWQTHYRFCHKSYKQPFLSFMLQFYSQRSRAFLAISVVTLSYILGHALMQYYKYCFRITSPCPSDKSWDCKRRLLGAKKTCSKWYSLLLETGKFCIFCPSFLEYNLFSIYYKRDFNVSIHNLVGTL